MQDAAKAAGSSDHPDFRDTSGPSATPNSSATKRAADEANWPPAGCHFVILRPGARHRPQCLRRHRPFRALAAFPLMLATGPRRKPGVPRCVGRCCPNRLARSFRRDRQRLRPDARNIRPGTLYGCVAKHRAWLGLPPARIISLPAFVAAPVSAIADALGWLGWARLCARRAMQSHAPWREPGQGPRPFPLEPASEFLAPQSRRGGRTVCFARLYLLSLLIVFCLSPSGSPPALIPASRSVARCWPFLTLDGPNGSDCADHFTCLIDIALALPCSTALERALRVCGMILVTLAYLAGSLLMSPPSGLTRWPPWSRPSPRSR